MRVSLIVSTLVVLVIPGCTMVKANAADEPGDREGRNLRYGLNVVWDGKGGTGEIPNRFLANALMQEVKDIGATVVRIGISWASLEEEKGTYAWEKSDPLVDMLAENNISVLACFCTTPLWASDLTPPEKAIFEERKWENLMGVVAPKKEHVEEFRKYAEECARRYRGKIDLYEFWNEEEGMGMPIPFEKEDGTWDIKLGGDPELYTYWLKEAYTSIKKGNPDARVAIGGMERFKENRFLRGLLDAGAKGYFDAVCIHPYGRPDTDYHLDWDWVEDTQKLLDENGLPDAPIWITEYGWLVQYKQGGINEARQAELLAKTFERVKQYPRVEMMTLHTLNDWGGSAKSACTMGIVSYDGERRLAWDVFQEAAEKDD